MSKSEFAMWFQEADIYRVDGGSVYISVPSLFAKEWILKKHHTSILRIIREKNELIRSLEYIIIEKNKDGGKTDQKNKIPMYQPVCQDLSLNNYYVNKEDNLNPRYMFDNFVVAPFNEIAHTAAQAVIKSPGQVYNPFFVYGGPGHGKTHLIQAMGNVIKKQHAGKKVFYLTSEKFGIDYYDCLQNGKMSFFKEKYRKYDVIIMDDVQFFSGKEKFQEEMFHLFNYLYDNLKQIIFSSDRHPNHIPDLEDRLKSRFGAGIIVDIPHPDKDSRAAIIYMKSKAINLPIENDIIDYLSENLNGNIRELEGILNNIIVQAQIKQKMPTLAEIKNIIKDISRPKKNVCVKDIVKTISNFYNIDENDIYNKTRKKEVVRPRQVIMYVLRDVFGISYPSIGEKLGGRDHTTVIHSCEKIKREVETNPSFLQEVSKIKSMLSI